MFLGSPQLASQGRKRQWRRYGVSFFATATLGGAIFWQGNNRQASDATQPLLLRGEATQTASTGTLRIGSFNIHGGRGDLGKTDLAATAAVLGSVELDLAGLFEVHGFFQSDQAEALGTTLEMASLYAATERRWWRDHFGNGILTRLPLEYVTRIALPGTQGKQYRNALLAATEVNGVRVNIVAAHLDRRIDRDRQLAMVVELFRSLEAPAVLMGDLNCTTDHPLLAELLADPEVVDAMSEKHEPKPGVRRVDHLFTRGLTVLDAACVRNDASDHPFLWAELRPEVPPQSSRTASLPTN